jgi:hypothetical protein
MSLRPGQKVKHISTNEVGVVVCTWANEHGDIDTYVAFLGSEFPSGTPKEKPYVLRYFASSLVPIE